MLSYILIVFILQEEGLVYNKLKENACLIETTKTYCLLTTYCTAHQRRAYCGYFVTVSVSETA